MAKHREYLEVPGPRTTPWRPPAHSTESEPGTYPASYQTKHPELPTATADDIRVLRSER